MEAMRTLTDHDGTIIARELAFRTCALEVDSANAARVVSALGQIPLPLSDGSKSCDRDLHDWRGLWKLCRSSMPTDCCCRW